MKVIWISFAIALYLWGIFIGMGIAENRHRERVEAIQDRISTLEMEIIDRQQLLDEIRLLRLENQELHDRMEQWLDEWQVEEMTVTAYAPLCDTAVEDFSYQGDPRITASGTQVVPGVTVAAGEELKFGEKIWIEGIGWRRVEDRGAAITKGRLDIAVRSRTDAFRFGRQDLKVVLPRDS